MTMGHGRFNKLLIGLIAMSIAACPLAWASLITYAETSYLQPFATVRPQDATFQAVFTETPPIAAPIATLGPGQYFEESDAGRPDVLRIEGGDEDVGYGPSAQDQSLYLMWYTDENGTHYRTVDSASQLLYGTIDPITGDRRDNGFNEIVNQREAILTRIEIIDDGIRGEGREAKGGFGVSFVLIGAGLAVCILATAGVCSIAAPLLGAAALTSAGVGVQNSIQQRNMVDQRETELSHHQMVDSDSELVFSIPEPPSPDE